MDEVLQKYMLNQHQDLIETIGSLLQEIKRLKEGEFTPEEFQNLCHTFSEEDKKEFCNGCTEYQKKLFGESPTEVLEKFKEDIILVYNDHQYCDEYTDNCNIRNDIGYVIEKYEEET